MGAHELDEFWEKLVLGAVGELIDPGNEVTGVRVIHKVVLLSAILEGSMCVYLMVSAVIATGCLPLSEQQEGQEGRRQQLPL